MSNRILLSALLLILSFFSAPGFAQSNASIAFPPELEADLSAGATAIYYLKFDRAREHLDNIIRARPVHPAAYFFTAMAKWYEITYDSLLYQDPALDREFEDWIDRTIDISKKFSKDARTESAGNLYWGGGLGAKGWRHVSRRQWIKAYTSGKKGFGLLKDSIRKDPELYDAYLGVGMYEYYAATLGPVLKVLSSFLVRGDREKALRELHLAETKSRYVRLEAAYFMWNAFMDEGRLGEASEKAKSLNLSVPQSPLFEWCEIQTLFYQKRWEDVLEKGKVFMAQAMAGPVQKNQMNPHMLLLGKVLYHCATAAINQKNYALAEVYLDQCIGAPSSFQGWKTMALLRRGELADFEGNRVRSAEDYRAVLNHPDVWDSRSTAKDRIKNPFRVDPASNGVVYSPLQQWRKEIPD